MADWDPNERAKEKQASRDQDARDLASGAKTREQLWKENTFLPARLTSVDILTIPIPGEEANMASEPGTTDLSQEGLEKAYPWALRIMRFDDDGLYPGAREAAEKVTPLFETEPEEEEVYLGSWWPPRSQWGEGPWMVEPDLVEWRVPGIPYPLVVVRGDMGALCGHVGVPPGHPCYGPERPVGVHSEDITAEGPGGGFLVATGGPSDLWWIGFDCAHRGESAPKMVAGFRALTELTGIPFPSSMQREGHYVELDECRKRTEALALELFGVSNEQFGSREDTA